MNTQSSHKIIKNKLGLLNLAQTLGIVKLTWFQGEGAVK